MKKFLSMALSLSMLLSAFPCNIASATDTTSTLQEILSYDFDSDATEFASQITTAKSVTGASHTGASKTDSSTYDIGAYRYITASTYLPLVLNTVDGVTTLGGVDRVNTPNKYLEIEYDYMPITYTNTAKTVGRFGVGAIAYNSSNALERKNFFGSLYHEYTFPTDTKSGSTTYLYDNGSSYKLTGCTVTPELDKWVRVKIVSQLTTGTQNNDGTYAMPDTQCIKIYINGELINQRAYPDAVKALTDPYIRAIGFHSNYGYASIDNLTVRTYQEGSAPADKGKLVAAIRNLEEKYPAYGDVTEAADLIASAKAAYKNTNATEADITTALANIEEAKELLKTASPVFEENFETSPESFFDNAEGSYVSDSTYEIGKALCMSASTAVKSIETVALTDKYITADVDVKVNGSAEIKLSDNIKYTLESDGTGYNRVRFDINAGTYDVYVNGDKKVTAQSITDTEISAFAVSAVAEYTLDNIAIYSFENAEDVIPDKGALVTALREAKALLDGGTMGADEKGLMETVFEKYEVVYKNTLASAEEVENAAKKMTFYNGNLSATMDGAKSVIIPGAGQDLEDVQFYFNLHYGSQQGVKDYDNIFFDGDVSTDFSDVRFYNTDGDVIQSSIESTGNYEIIEDKSIPASRMHPTADGKVVSVKSGNVAISADMGKTWTSLGFKSSEVELVDKDGNIWHYRNDSSVDGPAELYKIYAPDYKVEKLMVDTSNLWGLYNNYGGVVNENYNVTDARFSKVVQDDDGYVYAGLYQTEWTGATVFVSDSNGENFVVGDFRPDKQHVHDMNINRYVYPNEVYIEYDDSLKSPLCYVTTDHMGYEEIKDDANHQIPCKALSTGGNEGYQYTDDENSVTFMPRNDVAKAILANSKKHTTQIPNPYPNTDYFGAYFGLIEDMETSPEKFEYNEEMGKWYTIKDKEYYNELNGKTHYYSSNVYGCGLGEANILGGPSAYKTTDIMDINAYYPTIETAHGARDMISPADGIILWGGLTGGYAQTASLAISYDEGETWSDIYTSGYVFSTSAGQALSDIWQVPGKWKTAQLRY